MCCWRWEAERRAPGEEGDEGMIRRQQQYDSRAELLLLALVWHAQQLLDWAMNGSECVRTTCSGHGESAESRYKWPGGEYRRMGLRLSR